MTIHHEKLNNIITTPSYTFEDKGAPPYTIPLLANIAVTSNDRNPVKIPKDDRRWVAARCFNTHMRDTVYHGGFRAYFGERETPRTPSQLGVLRGLYQAFMSRGVEAIKLALTSNRPMTDFYKECTLVHAPLITKFLSSLTYDECGAGVPNVYPSSILFRRCKEWADHSGFKFHFNTTSFGIEMSSFTKNSATGIAKKRGSEGNEYHVDVCKLDAFLKDEGTFDDNS
jgi:hypothetical protein